MKKNCLVIGDLNVDLIVNDIKGILKKGSEVNAGNHLLDIGGSGGIFSAVLSGLGVRTYIISKIGSDFFGEYLIKRLRDHGTEIENILVEKDKETGVTINLSYPEDKIQVSSLNLIKEFNIKDIDLNGLDNIKHVHFSSYYMMDGLKENYESIISTIRKKFGDVTFSMDTNDDPSGKWNNSIYDLLPDIDIFMINEKESLHITKKHSIIEALKKLGNITKTVVIKLGERGYIAINNGNIYKGEAISANFIDSTGAGDNFDAGFIYGFLNDIGIKESLDFGNICGSKSVEYSGGIGTTEKFKSIQKNIEQRKMK